MKEMRLFEIGFKETPDTTTYCDKFYVAAEDADAALEKARGKIDQDWRTWWEEEGEVDAQVNILYDEIIETFGDEEIPAGWIEKRFDGSPPLQGEIAKRRTEALNRSGFLALSKLLDVGTVIV